MSRAIKDQLNTLRTWVLNSRSRVEKLVSGSETLGSRAVPTQTTRNDEKIGLRLNYGKQYEKDGKKYSRLNLQVIKGAEAWRRDMVR